MLYYVMTCSYQEETCSAFNRTNISDKYSLIWLQCKVACNVSDME